jgi:hypothetical protein
MAYFYFLLDVWRHHNNRSVDIIKEFTYPMSQAGMTDFIASMPVQQGFCVCVCVCACTGRHAHAHVHMRARAHTYIWVNMHLYMYTL